MEQSHAPTVPVVISQELLERLARCSQNQRIVVPIDGRNSLYLKSVDDLLPDSGEQVSVVVLDDAQPSALPAEFNPNDSVDSSSSRAPEVHSPAPQVWCEQCKRMLNDSCEQHQQLDVSKNTRARISCPKMLFIRKIEHTDEYGIFTRQNLSVRLRFGPFEAEVGDSESENERFPLEIFDEFGNVRHFRTGDESKCNWMKFVRPADSISNINLIAFQKNKGIYFDAVRPIRARDELRVWYTEDYFAQLSQTALLKEPHLYKDCKQCQIASNSSDQFAKHLSEAHPAPEPRKRVDFRRRKRRRSKSQDKKRIKCKTTAVARILKRYCKVPKTVPPARFRKYCKYCHCNLLPILFDKHLLCHKVHGKAQFACQFCRCRYFVAQQLTKHVGVQHGSAPRFPCTECTLVFASQPVLSIHVLGHLSAFEVVQNDALNCPSFVCHRIFDNFPQLLSHVNNAHRLTGNNQDFRCNECSRTFKRRDLYENHLRSHTGEQTKTHQCTVCRRFFASKSAMASHAKMHKATGFFDCLLCTQTFDSIKAFQEHVVKHRDKDGKFRCSKCEGKEVLFDSYQPLRSHCRYMHGPKTYECQECGASFPRSDKLRLHLLKHSEFKAHLCSYCGKMFKRRDKLKEHTKRMHLAVVSEQETMRCHLCDTIFCRQEKFREHMHKNHQETLTILPKPLPRKKKNAADLDAYIYKCHACQLGFKRRGMLVNHMLKTHPESEIESVAELTVPLLRPVRHYRCPHCEKQYRSENKRQAHVKALHPGRRLPVMAKNAPDKRAELVFETQTTHAPFPCSCCARQYASRQQLMTHIRREHASSRVVTLSQQGDVVIETGDLLCTPTTSVTYTSDIVSRAFETAVNTPGSSRETGINHSVFPFSYLPPAFE